MTSLKAESFTENDIIDPFKIIRYLESHLPRKHISADLVVKCLKLMCRHLKGIRITYKRIRNVRDCFAINGFFDQEKKIGIELEICCSSFNKQFTLNKKLHRAMIYDIADTLCHESIHRYQSAMRGENSWTEDTGDVEIDYYADPDEMFAFAANIAHNLYRQYGTRAIDELKQLDVVLEFDPYLADYYTFFYQQPKFKKLVKMIYLNLVAIDDGRVVHRP